jgi:hypothetical protein
MVSMVDKEAEKKLDNRYGPVLIALVMLGALAGELNQWGVAVMLFFLAYFMGREYEWKIRNLYKGKWE